MPVIKKGLTQHVLALRRRRVCVETLARANANDIDAERTPTTHSRPDPATRRPDNRGQLNGSRVAARLFTVKKAQDSAQFFILFFAARTV